MARKRPNRNATRRPGAQPRTSLVDDLATVRRRLDDLESQRQNWLGARDRLVVQARAAGVSWPRIGAAAGVRYQSLLKRLPGEVVR